MREDRFEQWGQLKGTIKLESEEMREIYLWGVKAKSYYGHPNECRAHRVYGFNTKGFGFNIGSVSANNIR